MNLAYLIARAVDDESWTGGLMVTDQRGLPLDFRYIEPIKPTKLQKLIYGGALKRYLLLDAIAGTLLKAVKSKTDWVFTSDPLLLELEGDIPGRFIIVGNGEREPLSAAGEWEKEDIGKIVFQVSPSGSPVQLIFNSQDDADTEKVADELVSLAGQLDFTEPLNRIGEALKEICQNGAD